VLSESVKPIVQSTVQNIPPDKLKLPELQEQVATLDRIIADKLGSPVTDDSIYKYDINDDQNVNAPEHMTPEYTPLKPDSSIPKPMTGMQKPFIDILLPKCDYPRMGKKSLQRLLPGSVTTMAILLVNLTVIHFWTPDYTKLSSLM